MLLFLLCFLSQPVSPELSFEGKTISHKQDSLLCAYITEAVERYNVRINRREIDSVLFAAFDTQNSYCTTWTMVHPEKLAGMSPVWPCSLGCKISSSECIILFQQIPDKKTDVIESRIDSFPRLLKRELYFVLYDMDQSKNICDTLSGVLHSDRTFVYLVPQERTAFYYFCSYEEDEMTHNGCHPIQKIYSGEHPYLYRIYLVNEGYPSFAFIVLSKEVFSSIIDLTATLEPLFSQ